MDWNTRAAVSGAFIDHVVETKGVSIQPLNPLKCHYYVFFQLDFIDKQKAKHAGKNLLQILWINAVFIYIIMILAEKELHDASAPHYE